MTYRAPFPWFGGKRRVAPVVWQRFGDVENYVEPFFGSGAVLLGRPGGAQGIETVNDKDGYVANFWRALQADPDTVAHRADWPANENDLHARHIWLVQQRDALVASLEGDPHYFDTQIAGWWVWGIANWIGAGFCSGLGPWTSVGGQLVHLGAAGQGVRRQRVHLSSDGQGVQRKRVHQNAGHERLCPSCGGGGCGLMAWMRALAQRLRRVRVVCGDWTRVIGPSVTVAIGLTGVLLDPPYSATTGRDMDLYNEESGDVAQAVREWAIAHGDDARLRIALCGFEGEHVMPSSWSVHRWVTPGGYAAAGRANHRRECIWFSPHCAPSALATLWEDAQ